MARSKKKEFDGAKKDWDHVVGCEKSGGDEMAGILSGLFLKYVLTDERVKSAIRNLSQSHGAQTPVDVEAGRSSSDGERFQRLEADFKVKKRQFEEKISELDVALSKARQREQECMAQLQKAQAELAKMQRASGAFQSIYEKYRALPSVLRASLRGFFQDKDVWTFLISGSQVERLLGFWDFCKTDLSRGRLVEHRDVLLDVFHFFFERINASLDTEPQWLLQTVKDGAAFDTAIMSATQDSASVGRVSATVWPGFVYATNKKVCRKSLVSVK